MDFISIVGWPKDFETGDVHTSYLSRAPRAVPVEKKNRHVEKFVHMTDCQVEKVST